MTPAPRTSLAALGLLLPLLKPYLPRVIAAIASLLLAAGLTLALGQGLKHLIDDGFAGGLGALDSAALVMGALITALAITTTTRFYLVSWLGERVAADPPQRLEAYLFHPSSPGCATLLPAGGMDERVGEMPGLG